MLHYQIRTIEEISDLIRSRRAHLSMSQGKLAERAGIGRQHISDIESSKSGMRVSRLFASSTHSTSTYR